MTPCVAFMRRRTKAVNESESSRIMFWSSQGLEAESLDESARRMECIRRLVADQL